LGVSVAVLWVCVFLRWVSGRFLAVVCFQGGGGGGRGGGGRGGVVGFFGVCSVALCWGFWLLLVVLAVWWGSAAGSGVFGSRGSVRLRALRVGFLGCGGVGGWVGVWAWRFGRFCWGRWWGRCGWGGLGVAVWVGCGLCGWWGALVGGGLVGLRWRWGVWW